MSKANRKNIKALFPLGVVDECPQCHTSDLLDYGEGWDFWSQECLNCGWESEHFPLESECSFCNNNLKQKGVK